MISIPIGSVMGLVAVTQGVRDEEPEALSLIPVSRQVHWGPSVFVLVPG